MTKSLYYKIINHRKGFKKKTGKFPKGSLNFSKLSEL